MKEKKFKIILYLPLVIFFIANIFYYPPPAKAAQTCSWTYLNWGAFNTRKSCNGTSTQYSVEAVGGDSDCAAQPKPPPSGLAPDPNGWGCCCKPDTPSPLNTTMPDIKIPDVNLQINIPGLNLTKGSAITCTEKAGIKTCNIPWISEYIAGIYKYAIGIVGILAAVVLMVGGVLWIIAGGSATMIGEAKSWIGASITGLVIALCSYTILYQVNPALVTFNGLNVQMVEQTPIPADLKEFSEKCKPTDSGACAISNMSIFGSKASEASAICMAESSGVTNAKNTQTKCSNGDYYAVWGLFQFNLSANYLMDENNNKLNCPDAFNNKAWVNSSPNCTVTNINLYNQCIAAASNPTVIINNAKRLAGSGWGPWEANSKWCKF